MKPLIRWIKSFLDRRTVCRRKITREKKNVPTAAIIIETMRKGQDIIHRLQLNPHQVVNLDETAIQWGIGPTHIYMPQDGDRGQGEMSDTKARFTAVLMIDANGQFLPSFYILKHSKGSETNPDQTNMRVIPNLNRRQGFKEEDGWYKRTWIREMSLKKGRRGQETNVSAVHKVNYLIHNISGEIITSQIKGWNDTIRMAMLIDLILKPQAILREGKLLVWMDNCSAHHVEALSSIFKEANVEVSFLPPNTTYLLQVLDLVVNGPLKAHIRRARSAAILKYFQEYRVLFEERRIAKQQMPHWKPPKPSFIESLKIVSDLILRGNFNTPKFKESAKKSFIATGCFWYEDEISEEKNFKQYDGRTTFHGTLSEAPTNCDDWEWQHLLDDAVETFDDFLEDDCVSDDEVASFV